MVTQYYIGRNDCAKATCNKGQEFENSPYCLRHSLECLATKRGMKKIRWRNHTTAEGHNQVPVAER
jgi:hypothetical protein